jgi:hypothetical protein
MLSASNGTPIPKTRLIPLLITDALFTPSGAVKYYQSL